MAKRVARQALTHRASLILRWSLPVSVVVARVAHVAIMVVVLGAVSVCIPTCPPMIAVALVVVAIAITYGDIAEVDGDTSSGGGWGCECAWHENQGRGQNGPFEQFHASLPF